MDVDAVEARRGRARGGGAERVDRRLELLRRGLADLAPGHHVRHRRGRQRLDVGQERLAAGVRELGEDAAAVAVDRAGEPGEPVDHRVGVDPDLPPAVAPARIAEHVAGEDQPDPAAGQGLVQVEELVGDLAAGAGHRFRCRSPDDPVANLDRADRAGFEQRSHVRANHVKRPPGPTRGIPASPWRHSRERPGAPVSQPRGRDDAPMTDTDSKPLVILVRLRALPGREEEVAGVISAQLELIREREPTCLAIAVHQSLEDPARFMLHETWADAASFEEFVTTRPYMLEYIERLTQLLEDREMTHWEVVGLTESRLR